MSEQYRSRVYTDRPPYADFDPPHKLSAIKSIVARKLYDHRMQYVLTLAALTATFWWQLLRMRDKRFALRLYIMLFLIRDLRCRQQKIM